jgi:hypothetical protein
MNNEISDNLDLRAVADIFEIQEILGIWKTTKRPQISNLDLNNDNEVDYLRVINCGQQNSCSYYTICTWSRVYQDVATIEIKKTDIIPFIYKCG